MTQWMTVLDRLIYGKVAISGMLIGTLFLGFFVLQPLEWKYFPNVVRMFFESSLFLVISGAVIASGLSVVAKRPGFPTEGLWCLVAGLIWQSRIFDLFLPLPFNFGRLLIIYGLAELVAHCIRRSRTSVPGNQGEKRAEGEDIVARTED